MEASGYPMLVIGRSLRRKRERKGREDRKVGEFLWCRMVYGILSAYIVRVATNFLCNTFDSPGSEVTFLLLLLLLLVTFKLRPMTSIGLQYSGPVITRRVQYGQQIQFNSNQI